MEYALACYRKNLLRIDFKFTACNFLLFLIAKSYSLLHLLILLTSYIA